MNLFPKRPADPDLSPSEAPSFHVVMMTDAAAPVRTVSVWKGLLRYEWHAHRRWLLYLVMLWLAAVWLLPWFTNPGWVLAFGLIYALLGGPAFGGKDVLEGCEEYAFALPATRAEWFQARLLVGGGLLALFTVLDVTALGLDLSQALAQLYIDTGLLRPAEVLTPRLLYGLVVALPVAIFGLSFALAANARSRSMVLTSWFWASVAALVILRLGLWYEVSQWGAWTGYVACPSLFVAGALALGLGYLQYLRKEIAAASKPVVIPSHWWWWGLLFLLGILLSFVLIRSIIEEFARILRV